MAGVFISFEGIDGCGKTTQVQRLYDTLVAAGVDVICLREPGGTRISEAIRAVLLDKTNSEMCAECELLLYEASRAQMVKQVVEPALAAGSVVLCDRFYDSTFAYQAGGRGLDAQRVVLILQERSFWILIRVKVLLVLQRVVPIGLKQKDLCFRPQCVRGI
nr:dTMP kinase [Atopobium minutum]